uniref:Wall-associated receptor kinase galacturonan-binding domain-containing protein n=1 Tax=Oryza brachyantha TaxID=4533 RepID=J3L324_ORYBR
MPLLPCRRRRLLLLLLFLLAAACRGGDASGDTYDISMCRKEPTYCGEVSISYPFYLANETKDLDGYSNSFCGYPGLAIDCDDGKPTLQLNGTDKYVINNISYGSITSMSLVDQEVAQDNGVCPKVDHNVTFPPGSWLFFPGMSVDYLVFLLGCSFTNPLLPITCNLIGFPGQSYVIPKNQVPQGNWSRVCQRIFEVPVLNYQYVDPNSDAWRRGEYGNVLRQGFQLALNDSGRPTNCTQCEESKGRCGYSQDGVFLGCLCPNGRVSSLRCSSSDTGKSFVSRSILLGN